MNQPNHRDYYVARAATSRELAKRAEDPAIAAIHTDFATRYDLLAAQSVPTINAAMLRTQAT